MQLCPKELKQIHLARQHLTCPTDTRTVLQELCGVQAQFMTHALHALRIRTTDFSPEILPHSAVKSWTVRGTIHVFLKEDLPLFIHAGNGADYRKNEWNGYRFWNRRDCWALTPARQKYLADVILAACAVGPRTREELKAICCDAGMTDSEAGSMFDAWGGGMRELCERGFLCYTAEEKKAFCLAPPFVPIPEAEAMLAICRRYLTHMAPATLADICYYFKCSRSQAKAWLTALSPESITVGGREYFYLTPLPDGCPDIPPCLFLAGFDPLMLAHEKKASLYLPAEYLRGIFNLAGIVMPPLLLDGTVAGRWKKTGQRLTITLFRTLTEAEVRAVKNAAEALWADGLRSVDFL